MKQFKIRCSAIGQIMTNSRKKGELSKTAQTYCKTWLKEQLSGTKKEFTNKYVKKGIEEEEIAIEYLQNNSKLGLLFKNEKWFSDDFKTGTPDITLPLIDIKSSWDFFTFPLFETEIPNKDYDWQLQGYMDLTGEDSATLAYILVNTPEYIVEKEIYFAIKDKEFLTKEQHDEIADYIRSKHNFDHLPVNYRIKTFEVKKDPAKIEAIHARVLECRNYINELLTQIK
jgi:hypothetical protein